MQAISEQEQSRALLSPLDVEDYDDGLVIPPAKKAKLVEDTLTSAMRNRHPLDLCWSVAAPVQRPGRTNSGNSRS